MLSSGEIAMLTGEFLIITLLLCCCFPDWLFSVVIRSYSFLYLKKRALLA